MADEKLVVEKTLAKPIARPSITKIGLPERQHFMVVVEGRETCVWAELKDMPAAVRDWILAQAEMQIKG